MILVIDDDLRRMESIIDQLRDDRWEVEAVDSVDKAWLRISENLSGIQCLILDIMMPAGNILSEEDTESGLRTGVKFFDKVRSLFPGMPILILTNVDDQRIEDRFSGEQQCKFYRKEELLPKEVIEQVRELVLKEPGAKIPEGGT